MGSDKATLEIAGLSLAERVANELAAVASPALIVGPEPVGGLGEVSDPGRGPLVAFAYGARALRARDGERPILLVACDLPFITATLLRFLASRLGRADAVVPVASERDQPLAACYSARAATIADSMAQAGARSMHALLRELQVERLPEEDWRRVAGPEALVDIDTPFELHRAREMFEH